MNDETLNLFDVIAVIKRHALRTVIITLLGGVLAFVVAIQIPPHYKSTAVLSIQSSYFRNPLVSDLIPEASDPAELNSLRLSLLRLALNDEFLDNLGERYNVYKYPSDSPVRITEREMFLKSIMYFSLSATNFEISIGSKDPNAAFEMTRAVLDQMTFTLIEERYKALVKARDAIQTQVGFLSRALRDVDKQGQTQHLQDELDKLNSSLSALRSKYTDSHPDVYKVRQQLEGVKARMKGASSKPSLLEDDDLASAFITQGSKAPIQDIYNDLLKKLSHLNIVLEMEKDRENVSYLAVIEQPAVPVKPFFPIKREFAAFGLAIGAVISLLLAAYKELCRSAFIEPETAAELLGVPFLGQLPRIARHSELLLIDGPGKKDAWKTLALPHRK